jgi:hypothetical protein
MERKLDAKRQDLFRRQLGQQTVRTTNRKRNLVPLNGTVRSKVDKSKEICMADIGICRTTLALSFRGSVSPTKRVIADVHGKFSHMTIPTEGHRCVQIN